MQLPTGMGNSPASHDERHSWENHKVIWKIFQVQYSFHTFETSIYIWYYICFDKVWKTKKKQPMKKIISIFSFPTTVTFWIGSAITTSQRQWLHDDLCGVTLAAVHRLGGAIAGDGPCWRLWSDVVGCGQSAPFQFRCFSGKKCGCLNSESMFFLGKKLGKKFWCFFVWSWQKDGQKVPTSQDQRLATHPAGHPGKHKGTCPSALPDPATPMSR